MCKRGIRHGTPKTRSSPQTASRRRRSPTSSRSQSSTALVPTMSRSSAATSTRSPARTGERDGRAAGVGLSYDLVATRQFADAGYTDTYRADDPDACAAPGVAWEPPADNGHSRQDRPLLRARGGSIRGGCRHPRRPSARARRRRVLFRPCCSARRLRSGIHRRRDGPGRRSPVPPSQSGELAATGSAAPVVSLLAGVAALIAGALLAALRRRGTSGES